jgi:CheY-like chemotaxis protein
MPLLTRKKLCVLVVDDDVDVLEALGSYLETTGLDVVTVLDPWEGIKAAVRLLPDVIVLDIAMPGLDGYDVVDALQCRQDTAAIPVIFYSARLREHGEKKTRDVQAYVQKSCTSQDLLGVIRMLGGRA